MEYLAVCRSWISAGFPIATPKRPPANERDLENIDQTVRNALQFVTAQTVDTVLNTALNRKIEINPTILKDIPEDVKAKSRKPVLRQ